MHFRAFDLTSVSSRWEKNIAYFVQILTFRSVRLENMIALRPRYNSGFRATVITIMQAPAFIASAQMTLLQSLEMKWRQA